MGADSAWLPSFGDEPIVSYSQNAEDVRLWRVFRTIENGFYVDIGRRIPGSTRSRCLFYEHGWSGINVEPSPCFDALEKRSSPRRQLGRRRRGRRGRRCLLPDAALSRVVNVRPLGARGVAGVGGADRGGRVTQRRLASILEEHAGTARSTSSRSTYEGASARCLPRRTGTTFRPMVVVVGVDRVVEHDVDPREMGEHPPRRRLSIRGVRRHQSLLRRSGPART